MENLKIDESINRDLRKAAGWIKFLAILLYIGMGLNILGVLLSGVGFIAMESEGAIYMVWNILWCAIGAVLCYFPASYGMRYSNRIKDALTLDNQQSMQEAFRALGSYFKFYGVLNIIILCIVPAFTILLFIFSAAAVGISAGY